MLKCQTISALLPEESEEVIAIKAELAELLLKGS